MAEAFPTPEYKCLLCVKPYNEPRELPCNHTFCQSCLTSYIDKEHRTEDEDCHYFPCPVCDTPTSPRDVNTDVNTWGTLFPINNLFITPTGKLSDDAICDGCRWDNNESNPADVWCIDCSEFLCRRCRKVHDRIKVTAKHKLVSREDRAFGNTLVSENCPNHEGRELEVYCLDHSSMCCCICVPVLHKHCNHIKPIDDVIKLMITGQPSRETAWETLKDEATTMLEDGESELTLLNSKEKDVAVEMGRIIQQAKDKLDHLNRTFLSQHADKCNALRKQLLTRIDYVKKFCTNTENSNILMTRFGKQWTDRQRFIIREKMKQQLYGHYRRMDQNTKTQPNAVDLKLNIGTVIDDIMKLTSIAEVDVTSKISSTSQNTTTCIGALLDTLMSTPSTTTFADSTAVSDFVGFPTQSPATVDVWTGSASCALLVDSSSLIGEDSSSLIGEDSSSLKGDVAPFLTGGIFTDNGELLATDYSNGRLLLFDIDYQYKREYKIDGMPTDVTRGFNTDEILVGIPGGFIRCTLRKGQLTAVETISCKGVSGIAVLGENILVCSRDSLEVMLADGTVKQSIQKENVSFTHLAASTSTSAFYYNDGDDMVCRRLDSDEEDYRYSDPGLKDAVGIGLDRDNNAYVLGSDDANVHIVSPDGSRGKIIVSSLSGINKPLRIIVHPTQQEFMVTSYGESTSLEVYRFIHKADVI